MVVEGAEVAKSRRFLLALQLMQLWWKSEACRGLVCSRIPAQLEDRMC